MKMKKFINDPANLTDELLDGLVLANKEIIYCGDQNMIINKGLENADRVTIVTQGGSGYEPAISGFVGEGMVDISVVGDIFAAPGPQACVDAIKLADKGKGVLYIVLNHAGDMLTAKLTMKQINKQGIHCIKVVTQEDVSNAPRENADDRRGLVGCIPTYKIAGAAAAEGKSLEEVAAIAQRFADNMATLAVAVRGATHPSTGAALADLGEDDMEIGMGQHGEGGGGLTEMKTADETAAIMLEPIQGEGGVNVPSKKYFDEIAEICAEKDILLILDEVQTGFGRCGTLFAHELFDIKADIMTIAKGVGGGVPMGAFLATEKVAGGFAPGDHGTTFGGGPLVCAAANAVLDTRSRRSVVYR